MYAAKNILKYCTLTPFFVEVDPALFHIDTYNTFPSNVSCQDLFHCEFCLKRNASMIVKPHCENIRF